MITVIDRKIVARIVAWIAESTQFDVGVEEECSSRQTIATTVEARVAFVSSGLRCVAASGGGGGSTPASGSASSRRLRSDGEKISTRNSTMNGSAGRRLLASTLLVGR